MNRHTERRIDAQAGRLGWLESQIRSETRPHGEFGPVGGNYQRGGRLRSSGRGPEGSGQTGMGGGEINLMGANRNLEGYARAARQFGLAVTSGFRSGSITSSGNLSHHASGHAIDLGGSAPNMLRFARAAARRWGPKLEELIHTPLGFGIKNGQRVAPYAQADHYDHVHLADVDPGGAIGGLRMGSVGPSGRLRMPRSSGGRGVAGVAADQLVNAIRAGAERQINRRLGNVQGGNLDGFSGGGSANANRRLAHRMMLAAGWPEGEWSKGLNPLWTQESGFNHLIANASSGAYGIPQSLPGSKMESAGRDWRTNPATQIKWGLNYIRERYGSPSKAWAFHQGHNWYGMGGRLPGFGGWFQGGGRGTVRRPTYIGVGEGNRPEDVQITPHENRAGGGNSSGRGQVTINFEPGSIVIHGGGTKAGRQAADAFLDRISEQLENMGMEVEGSIS